MQPTEKRLPASDRPRPKALVLSPEAPYPLDGGGALRTASLLHYFAHQYDVDLIAFQHPGQTIAERIPPGLLQNVQTVALREHSNGFRAKATRNLGRLLRNKPPLVDRFSGYEAEIAACLDGKFYDVALLEHFWTASYLPLVRRFARRTILDLHNIESCWHASCGDASNFPQSAIHRWFGNAARGLEKAWLPLCDAALTTSEQDAERVRAIAPGVRVCIYPNAIPFREPCARRPGLTIAFSGNMEYEPNRRGLMWFVSEVWPSLRRQFPALILLLIGKNEHAIPPAIRALSGVTCTGWVADSFESLSAAQVCIAPLRSGSGTRLKIIEAWAAERAVVATGIGAEGLGGIDGESILIADRPDAFSDAIARLLTDSHHRQKIAKSGRELFLQKYTWNVAWKTLKECLDSKLS
jgi:glycosyltransferase involved in cell wall biosynthesis